MEPFLLLSSVTCGKCKTGLASYLVPGGTQEYRCKCRSKIRVLLYCTHCQKPFLNYPHLVRKTNYCSLECYWIGTNKKRLRNCIVCQKPFLIKAYLVEQGFGFYCSKKCWESLQKEQRKILKCKQCQKDFSVPVSVSRTNPKYCSKTCKDDFERDYVSRICHGCKQRFELPRSDLNRGRGSFCSWICFKHYTGETSIERRVRLELQKLKEPFQQEVRFGRFSADFLLTTRNLIIECDGEYWHRSSKMKERDSRKERHLTDLGYTVKRLSEEEIRRDTSGILRCLLAK